MGYNLDEKMKLIISRKIGIPYQELLEMDDEEIKKHIEEKTGKKIQFPEDGIVDGYHIRTMEEVDKRIDLALKRNSFMDSLKQHAKVEIKSKTEHTTHEDSEVVPTSGEQRASDDSLNPTLFDDKDLDR